MSRKRLFEVEKLEGCEPSAGTSKLVHGLLTAVSPMKKGRFFDGRIADESSSMRLVGFDAGNKRN